MMLGSVAIAAALAFAVFWAILFGMRRLFTVTPAPDFERGDPMQHIVDRARELQALEAQRVEFGPIDLENAAATPASVATVPRVDPKIAEPIDLQEYRKAAITNGTHPNGQAVVAAPAEFGEPALEFAAHAPETTVGIDGAAHAAATPHEEAAHVVAAPSEGTLPDAAVPLESVAHDAATPLDDATDVAATAPDLASGAAPETPSDVTAAAQPAHANGVAEHPHANGNGAAPEGAAVKRRPKYEVVTFERASDQPTYDRVVDAFFNDAPELVAPATAPAEPPAVSAAVSPAASPAPTTRVVVVAAAATPGAPVRVVLAPAETPAPAPSVDHEGASEAPAV